MKFLRPALFVLLVLAQAGVLGTMIWKRTRLLKDGQPVPLRCRPIDPRSLMIGDYVRLNLAIASISSTEMESVNMFRETFKKNETVYVALEVPPADALHEKLKRRPSISRRSANQPDGLSEEPDPFAGRYREVVAISHDREKLRGRHPIVIRGTVLSVDETLQTDQGSLAPQPSLTLRYGVEEYFVPQHEGERIERELARVTVEAVVAGDGESAIRRLYMSGKEVVFQ